MRLALRLAACLGRLGKALARQRNVVRGSDGIMLSGRRAVVPRIVDDLRRARQVEQNAAKRVEGGER